MKLRIILVCVAIAIAGGFVYKHQSQTGAAANSAAKTAKTSAAQKIVAKTATPAAATINQAPNPCSGNTLDQKIIVSLSSQHLWACQAGAKAYDVAVTTGATAYGDGTPTGTWAVYSKQTNRHLTGSDERGSWDDFVNYWMPFNGDYGFHDASWQTFPFGSLTQYQSGGSHGCVHLPLDAMKWLYNWSSVGTSVTVQA